MAGNDREELTVGQQALRHASVLLKTHRVPSERQTVLTSSTLCPYMAHGSASAQTCPTRFDYRWAFMFLIYLKHVFTFRLVKLWRNLALYLFPNVSAPVAFSDQVDFSHILCFLVVSTCVCVPHGVLRSKDPQSNSKPVKASGKILGKHTGARTRNASVDKHNQMPLTRLPRENICMLKVTLSEVCQTCAMTILNNTDLHVFFWHANVSI